MKLKMSIVAIMAIFFSLVMSGSAFASFSCGAAYIAGVATTNATPSGMSVHLVNQASASIINDDETVSWDVGEDVKFFVSTENTDKTLAIILTAMSLGKTLWVDVSCLENGCIINVVSMSN